MNRITRQEKKITLIILLFSFLAIIPNNFKGLPVILLFIYSLIAYFSAGTTKKIPVKKILFLTSLFTILLPSLFYSSNLAKVDQRLISRLSLLIIPLSFGFLVASKLIITKKMIAKFVEFSIWGGFTYSLLIIMYLIQLYLTIENVSYSGLIGMINSKMFGINQHPIYASTFLTIPLLMVLISVFKKKIFKKKRNLFFILAIPIVVVISFLARKGVILSILFVLLFLIFSSLKKLKLKLIVGISILLLTTFCYKIPTIYKRFSELFNISTYQNLDMNNSTSIRVYIYKCCIKKIKSAPILGYGFGDVQTELQECYNHNSYPFKGYYNSHNQYFSYFLSTGIIGFLVLFLFVFINFRLSYVHKNIFLGVITIYFSSLMLFENILERRSGIIIFSFTMSLFNFYKPESYTYLKDDLNE